MKRRRRASTSRIVSRIAAALSLVLWITTILLWARSGSQLDAALWRLNARWEIGCISQAGTLNLSLSRATNVTFGGPSGHQAYPFAGAMTRELKETVILDFNGDLDASITEAGWRHWSNEVYLYSGPPGAIDVWSAAPRYWQLMILFQLLPAAWLTRRLRARIRCATGYCPACNYNLTANTSGVCPECGTAISSCTVPELSA